MPQDKGDVKTEGVKGNNFNRKRSQNKSVKQQKTRKMVPSENGVKRMRCGEKRMSREACLKKKRCPKIRMPRERDVNGKRLKRHRFQETAVTSEKASREKSVSSLWLQSCQQERLSRFRNVRSKPDQEKVATSDKDVESKKCQGQRLPRDHAVNGCASQGIRRCSYRRSGAPLSL